MLKRIYFDIETGPRPEAELHAMMPEFKAPANYSDPIKIAAVVTEKRNEWLEKAALCATTGTVLAIGLRCDGKNIIFGSGDEAQDLRGFWAQVEKAARDGSVMVGFNIERFDLPFLVRRSWVLEVPVPMGVYAGRYLNHHVFADIYTEWQCGNRESTISLKRLAEFLGCGTKDDTGKMFSTVWVTDRKAALAYLENDLVLTNAVADKILGPWPPVAALPTFNAPTAQPAQPARRTRKAKEAEPPANTPAEEAAVPSAPVIETTGVPSSAPATTEEEEDY